MARFSENEGQSDTFCLVKKAFGRSFQRCSENFRGLRLVKFTMHVAGAV